jgi:hypothetical protein
MDERGFGSALCGGRFVHQCGADVYADRDGDFGAACFRFCGVRWVPADPNGLDCQVREHFSLASDCQYLWKHPWKDTGETC